MATATLSSVPTVIDNAEATTNWGGNTFALNSGENIQGSNCVECAQTTNGNNDVYVTGTWDFSGTGVGDQHVRLWFNITIIGNLSATNPIQLFLYDGTNTAYYYWDKASSYTGGWAQVVVYTGDTPDSGTVTKSSITRIGLRFVTSSKPRNVPYNSLFDAWTYGDGYTVYGGTSGDPIDWSHIAAADLTNAYGILSERDGVYFARGAIQIGDGTNTTYFEPSGQLVVFTEEQVNSTLYDITFTDSASNLTNVAIDNGAWTSSAASLRYSVDASDTNINAFSMAGLQMSKAGTVAFSSLTDIQNSVFSDCLQVTPSTGTFENNTVAGYTGTDGALLWPGGTTVNTCQFNNNSRAVEITQTANQTFDALIFSSNTYDVHLDNGGSDINVSKNNGSNPTTYIATGGGVVTYVGASVTVKAIAQEADGTKVASARVFLEASDGTGPFPYQESVTISNSGTTATVTHTAHGLATGDKVCIRGASHQANNGTQTITVTAANTYTYTMTSTPGSSPTGTITSTFVALEGLTNASGEISVSRVYPSDQPISGRIRKSTSSPYYKSSPISGTVSSTLGVTLTGLMIRDE